MEFDPFVLARIQFAANISFHILFPSITIGLACVLLYFRLRFTLSNNHAWEFAYYSAYVFRVFRGKATNLSYE